MRHVGRITPRPPGIAFGGSMVAVTGSAGSSTSSTALGAGAARRDPTPCHVLGQLCVTPARWSKGTATCGRLRVGRAEPPPLAVPVWPLLKLAAGIGAGFGARASRTRRHATQTEQKFKEIPEALEHVRGQTILYKYLNGALEPWPSDFRQQQPLCDNPDASAIGQLAKFEERGPLHEVVYETRYVGDKVLVVAICDVQGHGFVCGLGLSTIELEAEQLAAQQALQRLRVYMDASNASEEMLSAAEAVKTHEYHAGASEPARHAAEVIAALGEKAEELALVAFSPCGKVWMSSCSLLLPGLPPPYECRVNASSADFDPSVAIALCSEVLIGRLRWELKVPQGAPHEPEIWAENVDERVASERVNAVFRPGTKRPVEVPGEVLRVSKLGGSTACEEAIEAALGDEEAHKERKAVLEKILHRREERRRRIREQASEAARTAISADLSSLQAQGSRDVLKRSFKVLPPEEDRRRKELVGKLPVEQVREQISAMLEDSQVTVVSGGTGSGKSTQLPQFILDDWREGGEGAISSAPRVVITQPRRIAAISIAERVAWERQEKVGSSVGYAVRGNVVRPFNDAGTLEFVTTGTLLRRAIADPLLGQCNVVVVDEVHERDMMTDFLLILLKDVLPRRPDMRLVLMSATLDVHTFTRYFSSCPVLEVPSAPRFPVTEVHLGDTWFRKLPHQKKILEMEKEGRRAAEETEDGDEDELGRDASTRPGGGDIMDVKLLELTEAAIRRVVPEVLESGSDGKPQGAVLCFLPGWAEIRALAQQFQEGDQGLVWAVPLHSSLPKEQQNRVFQQGPKGKVKVILGTNIAESSVTIMDVTVVIDSGLQRELTYDPKRHMSFLDTVWVSRSNAVQRKGRAGRVREGRVIRLFSNAQFRALRERPAPEMQRCDLAQSCLSAIALGKDPRKFLAKAPDPPRSDAVEAAMKQLHAIDAIKDGDDPQIMPLGEVLTRMPVEPLQGRAVMLGVLLGMPELVAAMVVMAGDRSPFLLPPGRRPESLMKQRSFCDWSDVLCAVKALESWEIVYKNEGERSATRWAIDNCLSQSRLGSSSRSKFQLLRDVQKSGLLRGFERAREGWGSVEIKPKSDDSGLMSEEEMNAVFEMGEWIEDMYSDDTKAAWRGNMALSKVDTEHEHLLTAVLCSAFPTNFAWQKDVLKPHCESPSFSPVVISSHSSLGGEAVRAAHNGVLPAYSFDGHKWCLFSELRITGGKGVLLNTTHVQDWQIALFGGLNTTEVIERKKRKLVLDGWLTVQGDSSSSKTGTLIARFREELREALMWQSLFAVGEDSALKGAERSQRLLKVLGDALSGREPDSAEVAWLQACSVDQIDLTAVESRATANSKAAPMQRRSVQKKDSSPAKEGMRQRRAVSSEAGDNAAKFYEKKTVAQLKSLLRDMGLKVTGKKADLVERLAEAKMSA